MKIMHVLERILVVLFGLAVTLVMLEAGLRLVTALSLASLSSPQLTAQKQGECRVLCIGDSFVAGSGVRDRTQWSYPSQLQKLFTQDTGMCPVTVINTGKQGENLFQIRQRLTKDIDSVSPSMVIFLGGFIQDENQYGYYQYLCAGSTLMRALDMLNCSSVVRLCRYLHADLQYKRQQKYNEFPDMPLNEAFITPAAKRCIERFELCRSAGNNEDAARALMAALRIEPYCIQGCSQLFDLIDDDNPSLTRPPVIFIELLGNIPAGMIVSDRMYYQLGIAYLCRFKYATTYLKRPYGNTELVRATDAFIHGLTTPWQTDTRERNLCYLMLGRIYGMCPDVKIRTRICALFVQNFLWESSQCISMLYGDKFFSSTDDWSEYEIRGMIDMCHSRNIPFVFQTYPKSIFFQEQRCNTLYRLLAAKFHASLIDHEQLMKDIPWESIRSTFDDYHCNEYGYRLMAEQVHDVLVTRYPLLFMHSPVSGKTSGRQAPCRNNDDVVARQKKLLH